MFNSHVQLNGLLENTQIGNYPICTPQESDEFDGYTLSPQWQWQANINEKWAYFNGEKDLYVYTPTQFPKIIKVYGMFLIYRDLRHSKASR